MRSLFRVFQKTRFFFCGKELSPFNEARYHALLEGLEIIEITLSGLVVDNEKYRLDSEFFSKKFTHTYTRIKSNPYIRLIDAIEILTDFHANGSYESIAQVFELLDSKNYAYMIRSTDLESNNFTDNVKYITEKAYNYLNKSKLFGGELIINKIGSPGKSYLCPNLDVPMSLGMNLFMIRLRKNIDFDEKYLWVYLNSKYGNAMIMRKVNGTVPLTIDKEAIKSLYISKFDKFFYQKISSIVELSETNKIKFKFKYTQAENLLLETLGLNNFQPSTENTNIKSFSESFLNSGRLDAEYYQPKYEEIIKIIQAKQYQTLGSLVNIYKSIEPGSDAYQDTGIPFIRVSNLAKFGLSQPEIYLDEVLYKDIKMPKKDMILLSKDGSVGIAYKVTEDLYGITSGAILHLIITNKIILADYLTLMLNSIIVKLQAERDAGGSIIQHWKLSEIEQVLIPIIDLDTQQKIADLVQQSFALKQQSEQLLDIAKRAVEIAIEQNEDVAMQFIQENTQEVYLS